MKYLIVLLSIILAIGAVYAKTTLGVSSNVVAQKLQNRTKEEEIRKIRKATENTPAEKYAEVFYMEANKWRIPVHYLLAIARLESSYFRACYGNNCFGYGIYGSNRVDFTSNSEAISKVARVLSTDKSYTKLPSWEHRLCRWNRGEFTDTCPYALNAQKIITDYENL